MIADFLDQDLYTFTVQQAVLSLYPDADVTYRFYDRGNTKYTPEFFDLFQSELRKFDEILPEHGQIDWLGKTCRYLKPWYLDALMNYRYARNEVDFKLSPEGKLSGMIRGKWWRTIPWEVNLLGLISECYFKTVDTEWKHASAHTQVERATQKQQAFTAANLGFLEFGSRRRRNLATQDAVVAELMKSPSFLGTSNCHLARKYNLSPRGTQSHQWYMALSVLRGLRHANLYGLTDWDKVYDGDMGTALTDTYTTEVFLKDFSMHFAKLFDGGRQDSHIPMEWATKMVRHYEKLHIDPTVKNYVFSDSLNVVKSIDIQDKLKALLGVKPRMTAAIGTHFSNDFPGSPALNIVIKLDSCMGIPVVKLSDVSTKATGDRDALRVARWTFNQTPLDA